MISGDSSLDEVEVHISASRRYSATKNMIPSETQFPAVCEDALQGNCRPVHENNCEFVCDLACQKGFDLERIRELISAANDRDWAVQLEDDVLVLYDPKAAVVNTWDQPDIHDFLRGCPSMKIKWLFQQLRRDNWRVIRGLDNQTIEQVQKALDAEQFKRQEKRRAIWEKIETKRRQAFESRLLDFSDPTHANAQI